VSGWRNSTGEKVKFTQEVNYPASHVNMQEGQSKAAMIRGHIAGAPKGQGPYRLVVNGIPLSVRAEGGIFQRPYSFGPGSNSVEVRSPDGSQRSRVQFYEAAASVTAPKLSVILTWDTDQTDLDLHVVSPNGDHCWYGDRVKSDGGALDVDVTDGYGPEIYSNPAPLPGTYLVFVNYYGSGPRSDLTVAQVTIVYNQNTPDERQETVTVPMRNPGELTLARSFVVN
jgi:uncharacterized protein YfaP (DUF2135 family)